jgi:hypothetical protein
MNSTEMQSFSNKVEKVLRQLYLQYIYEKEDYLVNERIFVFKPKVRIKHKIII